MENKYWVYSIKSLKDGILYVGMSKNIEERLRCHNAGQVFSTKGRRPWELIYSKFIGDRKLARKKEIYLKSGSGKEFLKKLPENNLFRGSSVVEQ